MTPLTRGASLLGLVTLLACSTTLGQTTEDAGNPHPPSSGPGQDFAFQQDREGRARHVSLVAALFLLSGRFEGIGAGNDLVLDLQRLRDPRMSSGTLLVTVSGAYKGVPFERSDLLRVRSHGSSPEASYHPDVDPKAARLAKAGKRLGNARHRQACSMLFKPKGEGFIAEAPCGEFFPGGKDRWTMELQPGTIRLRSLASNEMLEFSRTSR